MKIKCMMPDKKTSKEIEFYFTPSIGDQVLIEDRWYIVCNRAILQDGEIMLKLIDDILSS